MTDELWVDLGQKPAGTLNWMEIGAIGKPEWSTPYWFYAYKNNFGLYAFAGPSYTWEIAYNAWGRFGVKTIGGGGWCWYIGPNWESQWGCRANFKETSQNLQDGMEVADEYEPTNSASFGSAGEWMNGTIHNWNFAENRTIQESGAWTSHTCVSNPAPIYPGNISVATC